MFIAQNGEVSPGFPVLCAISADFFGRFAQGSAETVHFPGDFFPGKLGEIFLFCTVVVSIFCILYVYLLIIIIIIIIILVDVNWTHPFLLM